MAINSLPSVSTLALDDAIPVGSKSLGADAKTPLATLIAFIVANYPPGSISYEQLTDAATVNLPTLNAPLANALAVLSAELSGLQPALVSGTNIKTINGVSILGSGDLPVGGSGGGGAVTSVAGRTGVVVLVPGDVGLGNVENTSLATRNATAGTLTNHTINGQNNTLTNLPASGIAGVIPIANLATGTPNGSKFIRDDGTLASPSGSGTVTNTGGNLAANDLVLGAGTADTKVVAGLKSDGVSQIQLGVTGSSVGSVQMFNATSGSVNIQPPTGPLGTSVLTTPIGTDTLAGIGATQTLTNKTLTAATLAGVTVVTGASIAAGTAMTTAIDFTKPENDLALSSAPTLTVSGSPATGQSTLIRVTGDTVDRVVTLPAGTWRSLTKQATITTFTVPATQIWYITVIKTAAGYDIVGEPQPLSQRSWSRTQTTGNNETKTLCIDAAQAGVINTIYAKTSSGTIVVGVSINGTQVTGASCTAATTKASGTATAANAFAIHDVIAVTYSSNASAANADITVTWTPTLL